MTLGQEVVAALNADRAGCACARDRKPCEYHEGLVDGAELATRVLADAKRAGRF